MDFKAFIVEWVGKFAALPRYPMEPTDTQTFFACSIREDEEALRVILKDAFAYKVFEARAKHFGLVTTPGLAAFIVSMCKSPGEVVMWAVVLRRMQVTHGGPVTIDKLCSVFPFGFPSRQDMGNLWDQQKFPAGQQPIGPDNILDHLVEAHFQ